MKKVTCVVIGYGDRGSVYANFAITNPDEFEIVGVVEPNKFRLNQAKEKFQLSDKQLFSSFEEFIKLPKLADSVILATMDELHFSQGKAVLEMGYQLLIEKPVTNNIKELNILKDVAKKNNRIMMVCHVLRYAPFYVSIKNAILSGKIGKIIDISTGEYVGLAHTSSSFCRGKWRKESLCGSTMLLQKCCHDLDLICWLNNKTTPKSIVSYGSRTNLVKENAPKDSTDNCYTCPHLNDCKYSAKSFYVDNKCFDFLVFQYYEKPLNEITNEEIIERFKNGDQFGKCMYKTDADIVDHQKVLIEFEDGSTCCHTMNSGVPRAGRYIHILGTDGEIEGFQESNYYLIRKQDFVTASYKEIKVDVSKDIEDGVAHGGGDIGLIRDFVRVVRGEKPSVSTTSIEDSINGHQCVFLAEKSRLNKTIEYFNYSKGEK